MKKVQCETDSVRLDKWLWAARFYKTRALARDIVQGGKVHYNGQRCKPSRTVEVGAVLTLRQGIDEKEIIVEQLSDRRRGAPEAQLLYRETEKSINTRKQRAELRKLSADQMPHPDRKPDKKQRRQLLRVKNQ
ncbi:MULTISPECIES: ribosome-associated heat shock protein Hsp15 [Corallincola]|uniref:Heat shock protein 15 n=2 Tax=Corallincola TaxID=1775176 RepID=A0ABY1WPS4_9GAMM|nr:MULTISPECIES: ribosome-associated heat shock protein Hsp15 [Corallincola]TAA46067.1 ribosome-associated heat shock protein Hsp15 [Corallincola spongiicola]TCI01431.1 ribosome-associated heat shock protein Hsp15 [Corallincola luteus]